MACRRSSSAPGGMWARDASKVARLSLIAAFAATTTVLVEADSSCTGFAEAPTNCTGPKSAYDYFNRVLEERGYDKTQQPGCEGDGPLTVEVQFYMGQFNEIDQKAGTIALTGYLRTWWKDPRLAFNDTANGGCVDSLSMAGEDGNGIWLPDIFIDGAVSKATDGQAMLTIVSPDGSVWRSEQTTFAVKSTMEMNKLPYDDHVAEVVFASFSSDATRIRVIPRGGATEPGPSGTGLSAAAMNNSVWQLPNGTEYVGFKTPGIVVIEDNWYYTKMLIPYSRKPKFFIDQVIIPSILFLLVSYIQYWVDPNIVPARAFLTVIPILIMRSLSNAVYRSLPEGMEAMWLGDNLSVFTYLSVLGALHFGLVQHCRGKEKACAAKKAGLQSVQEKASAMVSKAHSEKMTLLQLMEKCKPEVKDKKEFPTEGKAMYEGQEMVHVTSKEASHNDIKEHDLLFIEYTHQIFKTYDKDNSEELSAWEVRQAFTYFDIYLSMTQAPKVMCMYLRDTGAETPLDEKSVKMRFSQFCGLVVNIDKYLLSSGGRGIRDIVQASPPSKRLDLIARVLFPILLVSQMVIFYALLPAYE